MGSAVVAVRIQGSPQHCSAAGSRPPVLTERTTSTVVAVRIGTIAAATGEEIAAGSCT